MLFSHTDTTVILHVITRQVMSEVSLCKCNRLRKRAAADEGVRDTNSPRAHTMFTQSTTEHRQLSHTSGDGECTICVFIHMYVFVYVNIQDFLESVFVFALALTWALPLTVRCWGVGWQPCHEPTSGHRCLPPHPHQKTPADDRFNQKRDGIWEAGQSVFVHLHSFPHSSSVWVDAGSFHKLKQTSQDRVWWFVYSIFTQKNHNVVGFTVNLWAWMNLWVSALWMLMNTETKQPYTDHQILHLFSAYTRLDACHALWSELWSEINIQPHIWRITLSSSAHRSWAQYGHKV